MTWTAEKKIKIRAAEASGNLAAMNKVWNNKAISHGMKKSTLNMQLAVFSMYVRQWPL